MGEKGDETLGALKELFGSEIERKEVARGA